ncbi:MAG: bifunctional [glutamine synthetase] adenylyltransferase/[glutamine synthetase]-adenylyl-L-tyrosine phosphorylase, partial [Acidimicrobiales bacterium]
MSNLPPSIEDAARSSAAPTMARITFARLLENGTDPDELHPALATTVASVASASPSLGRLVLSDVDALSVLASSSEGAASLANSEDAARLDPRQASDQEDLVRRKRLSYLRIAARDLAGLDGLEEVGRALSVLADRVLDGAVRLAGAEGIAVIAMGKHGAAELNYASDVDVLLVSESGLETAEASARARRLLRIAGTAFRIDTDLRPEGRNGVIVRTLDSYEAYWERWARPWEFQALLKARPSAGAVELGDRFLEGAETAVWGRTLDSDAIAELRSMKARSEAVISRRGVTDRELKRGPGGIRDIEFSIQLLQLVHGGADRALRERSTLGALGELSSAGYVAPDDGVSLGLAYRFLRTVEHRLQLVEEAQVHTVPREGEARDLLARVLGFLVLPTGGRSDDGAGSRRTTDRFDLVLNRYRAAVRSIHERLFFRPLLEVFGGGDSAPAAARLSPEAAAERLAAFGFRDAARTRQAL